MLPLGLFPRAFRRDGTFSPLYLLKGESHFYRCALDNVIFEGGKWCFKEYRGNVCLKQYSTIQELEYLKSLSMLCCTRYVLEVHIWRYWSTLSQSLEIVAFMHEIRVPRDVLAVVVPSGSGKFLWQILSFCVCTFRAVSVPFSQRFERFLFSSPHYMRWFLRHWQYFYSVSQG